MKKRVMIAVFAVASAAFLVNADVTLVSDDPSSPWTQDAQGVWSSPAVPGGESSVASFVATNPCIVSFKYKLTRQAIVGEQLAYYNLFMNVKRNYDGAQGYFAELYATDDWSLKSYTIDDDSEYESNMIVFEVYNNYAAGDATACLRDIEVLPIHSEIVGEVEWKYIVDGNNATIISAVSTNKYWDWGSYSYAPIQGDLTVPATFANGSLTVTEIGDNVLRKADITSLTFPDGVTKIGQNCVTYCGFLTNVTFGTGLAEIGSDTFNGNAGMLTFTVPAGNTAYSAYDGALYDKAQTKLLICPAGKTSLSLASTTLEIADSACSQSALATVTLNSGLKVIGASAFYDCNGLTAIDIPSTVDVLNEASFANCTSLRTVTLREGLKDIASGDEDDKWCEGPFMNCGSLQTLAIPDTVTNIGCNAFADCDIIDDVYIGSAVATIGFGAFASCDSLMNFAVSPTNQTFEAIGGSIFYKATPTYEKSLALYPSGRGDLYFTGDVNVTEIGYGACFRCDNFVDITVTNSVRNIGVESFENCTSLERLVIPDGITNICESAFELNLMTMYIEIAGSVERIGENAFVHNYVPGTVDESALGRLVLHEGIKEIGPNAFEMCGYLGEIVIPDSVTNIGYGAFQSAQRAKRIVIGNGVTEIPDWAFAWCTSVGSLEIGTNVVTIGDGAFNDFEMLSGLEIPDSVVSIGNEAFQWCAMSSLKLSENLAYIGTNAFDGCWVLSTLVVPESVEAIAPGAFNNNALQAAYVPKKFEGTLDVGEVFGGSFDSNLITWYESLTYFTVTFDANYPGGATTTVTTLKYIDGVPVPARDGFAFTGWWTDAVDEMEQLAAGDEITSNTTYYAHWATTPFTFGGDAPWFVAGYDYDYDATILQSAPLGYGQRATATTNFTGTGYIALNYYNSGLYDDWRNLYDYLRVYVDNELCASFRDTEGDWKFVNIPVFEGGKHVVTFSYENGSGAVDSFGQISFVEWRPQVAYTVTFDENYEGGTTNVVSLFGGSLGDLPVPSREGYVWTGWFTSASGGTQVTAETTVNENMTVYAQWYKAVTTPVNTFNSTGGHADWTETDGVWCSGHIGNNQSSWATVTVTGPCEVSFQWNTSSESDYDWLTFYVDDVENGQISGTMSGWTTKSVSIAAAGSHVLKWTYSKDGSQSSGDDCGWVKELVVVSPESAGGPEPPPVVIDDTKMNEPVETVDGTRVIEAKDGTTLTQADVDDVKVKSPVDSSVDITDAYTKTLSPSGDQIVLALVKPEIEPVAAADKDEDDATGLLEDNVPAEDIAAAPIPDTSDPDPANHEEVGALPVKMYPGLYYQAGWGSDLNSLTYGTKFRANGLQTHIGVIKQKGPCGFYKLIVSER